MKHRVLIADDEPSICRVLSSELEEAGFQTSVAYDGQQVLSLTSKQSFDCVVLDMQMPNATGVDCIRTIKERRPDTIAIVMTAFATVERAVEAMKAGADDYIQKPFEADELIEKVKRILTLRSRKKAPSCCMLSSPAVIVGEGEAYDNLRALVQKIAGSSATVLITGESGTGKGVVARAIHAAGEHKNQPFVHVTCSALPSNLIESELFGHEKGAFTTAHSMLRGKFELAEQGTIFLDEIGTLPFELQAKLLNVLQERAFFRVGGERAITMRARVIAATNEKLESAVAEGRFRNDLYYRLNVIRIECPALRMQKEALDKLVPYFLEKYAGEHGGRARAMSPGAMDAMRAYDWPGNVRELENVIESIVVLSEGETIALEDLPPKLRGVEGLQRRGGGQSHPLSLREQEISAIIAAMERNAGHRGKSAQELGISIRTLHYKLKQFNLNL